jgi:hypothetical protein
MNKIHEWLNSALIALVLILVLVGGNQSVPKGETAKNDVQVGTSRFQNGLNTRGGFTEGSVDTISTTSATYTLTQEEMDNVKVISISAQATAAALTLTLPASSTMTALLPLNGDTQSWIIDNLHTSAATTTTVTAGTGVDIDGITANDDVINGGVSARLECWRLPDTNIRCIIEEMVDAG